MILKVRKPGGWALIDNIASATFQYSGKGPFRIHAETSKWEVFAEDFQGTGKNKWQPCDDSPVDHLYMDTHFGRPLDDGYYYPTVAFLVFNDSSINSTVVFNTDAYFMNENGKTIESVLGC